MVVKKSGLYGRGEGSLVNKVAVQTSFRRIVNSGRFQTKEAEFLDEIQTKVFRVFLLAVNSHIYSFALRYLFLQTQATSYILLQFSYCTPQHCAFHDTGTDDLS